MQPKSVANNGESRGARAVLWGLGIALLVSIVALSVNPSPANDLFWQLRFGRDICATGQPPQFDTYSWTRHGSPLVMHEWLAFVLFWKAYSWGGGFGGVWLLQVLLTMLVFGALFFFLNKETEGAPLTAFLLTIVASLAASPFFQPRPHLYTYLFLTITAGLALRVMRHPKRWKILWVLPPLCILWSNLHAGVLVGVIVLTCFAAGEAGEACLAAHRRRKYRQWAHQRRASRFLMITIACGAATLVNPYGWHLHHNLLATVKNKAAMDSVLEWASPDFHDFTGKLLEWVVVILVCGLAFSQRRRRLAPILILLLFTHVALGAFRNLPLLAMIGLLMVASHVQSALMRLSPQEKRVTLFGTVPPRKSLAMVAVLLTLIMTLDMAARLKHAPETGPDVLERLGRATVALDSFPERACRFLEAQNLPSKYRLYNDYDIGGYLIWRLPQHPVFIDGRADLYFDHVLEEYLKVHKLNSRWRDILAKYNPEIALLSAQSAQAQLFLVSPDWKLIYSDANSPKSDKKGQGMVFVRRLPEFAHLPEWRATSEENLQAASFSEH